MRALFTTSPVLLILLSTCILFGGCGRASDPNTTDAQSSIINTNAKMAAAPAMYDAEEAAVYDDAAYESEDAAAYTGAGSDGLTSLKAPEKSSEKLIYNGSIRLQTLDYKTSIANIRKKIEDVGGFVQYENETDGDQFWYYENASRKGTMYSDIQARIPSDKFSEFVDSVSQDGQVMSRNINVENVSQQYSETEASVKAYQIERDRLLEMMDKAETIEDMIAVEARLSEVEKELSMYKTDLAALDRDIEYSTISISIEEVREYTEETDDSTFGSRLKESIKQSWKNFKSFAEGLLHLIIYLIPFLAVAAVVILIIRFYRRKHPDRRAKRRGAVIKRRRLRKDEKNIERDITEIEKDLEE